jgi:hypothetical protein
MVAVLEDAVDVYRHVRVVGRRNRNLLRETESWLRSDDRSWVFSFCSICDAFELDPRVIRATLFQERLERRLAA